MKKGLIGVLVMLFYVVGIAQDKTVTIPLEKNESLLETLNLGDNGIIIKTGNNKMNAKDVDWKLRFYTPELDLKWELPVEKNEIGEGLGNNLVSSKNGDVIYHVTNWGYNKEAGTIKEFIIQIKKGKITKKTVLDKTKGFGHLQQAFCDNDNLYFLATKNGKETQKSKIDEKLILNTINGTDFSYKQYILDLPQIEDVKNSTFWTYVGHNEGNIYIASKTAFGNKLKYTIITIDSKGTITNKISVEAPLGNKNVMPSMNVKNFYGVSQVRKNDFYKGANPLKTNDGSPYPDTYWYHNLGAFSDISFSRDFQSFYIYGFYGKTPYKKKVKYDGVFVYKYNIKDKKLLFSIEQKTPSKLKKDLMFYYKDLPYHRILIFKENKGQSIKFQIVSYQDQVCSFNYSKEGVYINNADVNFFEKIHLLDVDYVYWPHIKRKLFDIDNSSVPAKDDIATSFIKKMKKEKKDKTFINKYYNSDIAEIIIVYNPKYKNEERVIKILTFIK